MKKQYSDMTNYKSLFSGTYWGKFSIKGKESNIEELKPIFENRNKFVENYDILKELSKKLLYVCTFLRELEKNNTKIKFDHVEVYRLVNDEVIVLNSPYGDYEKEMLNDGWKKEDKLYNNDANSYTKIFPYSEVRKKKTLTNADYLKKFIIKNNEKIKCEICDGEYSYFNKSKHNKTKVHLICLKKNFQN